jgi:NADPH-dependent curcumin reductase CurA
MALAQAKPFARFVQCGAISEYNKDKAEGIKNYTTIISMRIRMQGFIVFDFLERYGEARKQLAQWLSEGKLKRKETVVKGGLSQAESALLGLFKGQNMGKYNSDIGIVKTLMVE